MSLVFIVYCIFFCIGKRESIPYSSLVVPGATTATSSRTHVAMMNGHYYNFLPSWTVDGNINQSILACLHTAPSAVTEAWLRIDLGSVKSVFSIQMWYRNDRPDVSTNIGRLRGYVIRVVNDTDSPMNMADVCFTDSRTVYNSTVLLDECKRTTRFIVIYQNHKSKYDSSPILEICEVQVYGCETGYYGINCSKTCAHCKNNSTCDIETGDCDKAGCALYGYTPPACNDCFQQNYGDDCSLLCSEFCVDGQCNSSNGVCLQGCGPGYMGSHCNKTCPSGSYGEGCKRLCGQCLNGITCHHVNGTCEDGCGDGFLGEFCTTRCETGYYGINCSKTCTHCKNNSTCDIETGDCDKAGCALYGYTPPACNDCFQQNYGDDCSLLCSEFCVDGQCNSSNGVCLQGCQPGYLGSHCNKTCPSGSYGEGCKRLCGQCLNGITCHHVNGTCENGCGDGFLGEFCTTPCPSGSYGEGCKRLCGQCLNGITCHHVNGTCEDGCGDGFLGEFCTTPCPSGSYGEGCKRLCGQCLNGITCHHVNGTCEDGCGDGFLGEFCTTPCPSGSYGEGCKRLCGQCLNGITCHHVNGTCEDGCGEGFLGEFCTTPCPSGSYGEGCKRLCGQCLNGITCHHVNGTCEDGCGDGFLGEFCTTPCINGTFGPSCLYNCSGNCFNNKTCDTKFGQCQKCAPGWGNSFCNKSIIELKDVLPVDDGSNLKFLAIPISLCSVIVFIILSIVFVIRRNQGQSRQRIEEHIYASCIPSVTRVDENDYDELDIQEETTTYRNLRLTPLKDNIHFEGYPNRPILITDLLSVIQTLEKHSCKGFKREYESLPTDIPGTASETGKLRDNIPKNRCATILPYDHSRVTLLSNNDYINANFIKNVNDEPVYIASQDPLQNTISDFWQMVWQEQVHVIALINNNLDSCKDVSVHYWPDSNDCVKETDKFIITLVSQNVYASFAIRYIVVHNKEISESYDITHLEFNSWSEHVMPNPLDLVIYHTYVSRAMEKYPDSKLLVHSSLGIGPTAVIIALDALYKHGLVTGVINIQEFASKMRIDRIGMIQNLDQYICLYNCLYECFRAKMCVVTKDELQNDSKLLRANNEFCILVSMKSAFINEKHSLSGKKDLECEYEMPKGMDREDMLIPKHLGQHYGILLSSSTTKDCIVAACYPSHGEAVDLIRLLIDQKCGTLVSLNPLYDVPYSKEWYCIDPSDDLTNFQVEVIQGPKVSQHVSLSTLRMRIHSTQNWHQVTVYQIISWELVEKLPPDISALLDVIKIIQLDKSSGSNTDFVVLSRDGAPGCGVFCAVYNAIQQLQQDEEVDMFTIARQLQSRRPEMISEMSEYLFCYQTAKKYVMGM